MSRPPPALAEWFRGGYIHGDRFAALADVRIGTTGPVPPQVAEDGDIVYCQTDRVEELFALLHGRRRPCVLITHNADRHVDGEMTARKPDCVRHWFAQNLAVEHPNVTPIPIGLERPSIPRARTQIEAFPLAACDQDGGKDLREVVRKLAYLNHADWTNRRERLPIRWSLCWRDWVTVRRGPIPFPQYLREMAMHRSVISPWGNGLDCHRTWEALYLGVIPLVRESSAMRAFARLFPIAVFPRLTTLTRRGVEQRIGALASGGAEWQDRLRFSWWEQRILQMRDRCCR